MSVTGGVTEGPALSAHLEVLLEKLECQELLNVATICQVREMKKWGKMLIQLHPKVGHAENIKNQNTMAIQWLEELEDLAYNVEDILDELSIECLRRKVSNRERHAAKTSHIRKLIPASFTQQMSEMQKITARLKSLVHMLAPLENLIRRTSRSTSSSRMLPERRLMTRVNTAESMDIRDDERKKILELLSRDEADGPNVGVIPIVGIGGVGKTTLAKLVYDDNSIRDHFQVRAWVCVSEDGDIMGVSLDILGQITQNSDRKELNVELLQLNQALAGKKFLIVLDDVWSVEFWPILYNLLRDGAPGSKIIVTTRDVILAKIMGTVEPEVLNPLSDDDCWNVFAEYAFESSTSISPELLTISFDIVRKCKGLPLAAKALGLMLRGRPDQNMWEDVLNNDVWDESSNIMPAQKLSYDCLPSYLKRCFLYCAIFPKNYIFEKKQIILLWKSEGLIPPGDDGSNVEEQGSKIFDELLSRSFFEVFNPDNNRFVMHDFLNDLAKQIVGDICVRFEGEDYVGEKFGLARFCSYTQGDLGGFKTLAAFHKMERLRSFLPFSHGSYPVCYLPSYFPNELVKRHRYLRVLSFSRCNITELPSSIGALEYLRYLDLSYTQIEVLPDSTTSLYNLQTLILEECENLRTLPARMDKLINLFHLNIRGVHLIEGMPLELKELRGLQVLTNFVVGKGNFSITTLKSLNSLRGEICISNLDNVKNVSDAGDAKLMEKTGIHNLELTWNINSYMEDGERQYEVLDKLKPHSNLEKLVIKDYAGTKLPSWVQDLNNLVHLKLEGCERCTSLPGLGILRNLKELFIIKMTSLQKIDQQFYGNCPNPFQSLEVLCFRFMDDWKMWNDCGLGFEKLRELCVGNCGKLSGNLPAHLPSLEVLVVNDCENLVASLPSLQMLSALEIRNCKEVDFKLEDDFRSLNTIVLSNISTIRNLANGLVPRLKKFKNLTMSCESNFTMTVPSSLRQYGGVVTNLECVFQKLPSTNLEQLQELERSEIEVVTLREFKKLPARIQKLKSLRELIIEGCQVTTPANSNNQLPAWIQKLKFLRELIIEGCQVTTPGDLPSMLKVLSVIDCNEFANSNNKLPAWIQKLKFLWELIIEGWNHRFMLKVLSVIDCNDFGAFSDTISRNRQSLQELELCGCDFLKPFGRGQLPPNLKKLSIVDCKNLKSLFEEDECGSSSFSTDLEDLFISGCDNLTSISYIPEGKLLSKLKRLDISSCRKLKFIVKRFDDSIDLKWMYIRDCGNLKCLPEGLHNLVSLCEFEISGCPRMVSFPRGGLPTALKTLKIKDLEKLKALPDNLHTLSSLEELHISNCTSLVSFPSQGLPPNLTTFSIKNLGTFEWGLDQLNYLLKLDIEGGCKEEALSSQDETQVKLPSCLTHLAIRDFPNMEHFSTRFQELTRLKSLTLCNCPKLASFPENDLLDKLLELDVRNCPMLEKLWEEGGQEQLWWSKICNIPIFEISDT